MTPSDRVAPLGGFGRGQGEPAPSPHQPVKGAKRGIPLVPICDLRHRPPLEPVARQPGLRSCCVSRLPPPPRSPLLGEGARGRAGVAAIGRKQVGIGGFAGGADRGLVHPSAGAGAAPARVDRPDRHLLRAAKLLGHEIADRRGMRRGLRSDRLPLHVAQHPLRRGASLLRDGQEAQLVVVGLGGFVLAAHRPAQWPFHVRLARAEPDVADHQVICDNVLPVASAHGQPVGPAGLHRRQRRRPETRLIGGGVGAGPAEPHRNSLARRRSSAHMDRPVALDHRMIAEQRVDRRRRRGGGGNQGHDRKQSAQHMLRQ